jgi:hypothetical protein
MGMRQCFHSFSPEMRLRQVDASISADNLCLERVSRGGFDLAGAILAE